ncbi:site-specific integrase [Vibrio alginolyticus]|nr:site-specific integrase [Vibrio alginolyticus]
MALTDSKLKALNGKKHDKAPIKIADRDGLTVYHRKTGKLSFVFRYRYDGKPQDLTLGTYPVIGLSEARAEALKCRKLLADGYDPKLMRQLDKEKILKAVTVKDALEYWLDNYASKNRANHQKHRAQFDKHVFPHIGHLPLEQCETRHWVQVFDDITNGTYHRAAPKASGYVLQNCKQALKFCRQRQFASSRALDDLEIGFVGEQQEKRSRFLTWPELMDVWEWSQNNKASWYYRNLIRLLICFGARTQEIRLSKISEWNLDEMIWTVPPEHNKTSKKDKKKGETGEIRRPIPVCLKEYIQQLINESKNEYLLGELKRPEAVSAFCGAIWKKLEHQKPWTAHDLRRSFSTHLHEFDAPPHIIEALLAHSVGGVAGTYNRANYDNQKLSVLTLWLTKLNESEQHSNVRAIR